MTNTVLNSVRDAVPWVGARAHEKPLTWAAPR